MSNPGSRQLLALSSAHYLLPLFLIFFLIFSAPHAAALTFDGPWDKYIQSPQSRAVSSVAVYRTTGNVSTMGASAGKGGRSASYLLDGPGASITFDFGRETAGLPTIHYGAASSAVTPNAALPGFACSGSCQALGIGYTEDVEFVGDASDVSGGFATADGVLYLPILRSDYTLPPRWGRGGFRYLTLSLGNTTRPDTAVELAPPSLHFTAEPVLAPSQLRDYTGYFYSSDDLLNRVWYAGVYTAQLCTIGANTSVNDSFPATNGWAQDVSVDNLSPADMFSADGAKRDRSPWAGDLSVTLPTMLYSRNYDNLVAVRNSLLGMIPLQDPVTHYFPWGGSPVADILGNLGPSSPLSEFGSDTYHLYTIFAYCRYVLVTSDVAFAEQYWPNIDRGIKATYAFVNPATGLFNGTRTSDWGRNYQGGENTALNAIFYETLNALVQVAPLISGAAAAETAKWQSVAARVKKSANALLYDTSAGLFVDNSTAAGRTVYPQDCNALAVTSNLVGSAAQAATVTARLRARWTPFGAPTPELAGTISPFISSSELRAHFLANPGDSSNGVALIRLQWGYMLKAFSPDTMVEGYATDGTLNYGFDVGRQSFISLAHGWGTGPTASLLEFVVGIRGTPISAGATITTKMKKNGATTATTAWLFQPQAAGAGLASAEGAYSIPGKGTFSAKWTLSQTKKRTSFQASLVTPGGMEGAINVPLFGQKKKEEEKDGGVRLVLDGRVVTHWQATADGAFASLPGVRGGEHSVSLTF